MVGKLTTGRKRLQMLDYLYENNRYEVLKRTAENRSAWKKALERKCQKPAVEHTTEERETERDHILRRI